jgi:hypothetical protein
MMAAVKQLSINPSLYSKKSQGYKTWLSIDWPGT